MLYFRAISQWLYLAKVAIVMYFNGFLLGFFGIGIALYFGN